MFGEIVFFAGYTTCTPTDFEHSALIMRLRGLDLDIDPPDVDRIPETGEDALSSSFRHSLAASSNKGRAMN